MAPRSLWRRIGRAVLAAIAVLVLVAGGVHTYQSRGPDLPPKPDGALRIATYNVHYILIHKTAGKWSLMDWDRRKGPMDLAFKALDADLVAFQEMESFAGGNSDDSNLAREWLLTRNPDYAAAAVGDWRVFPSTQPIFYRTARLKVTDQGWFFFSETPDVIYSRTFDGSYPAFASWATFEDLRSGAAFRVVNVHLDYASGENRRRSTDLIAARLGPWIAAGETVLLAGDLNALHRSALHEGLAATGMTFLPVPGATYHFDLGVNLFGAIDHVGYSAGAVPLGGAVVLREKFGGLWPTDHYPVVADFRIGG